MHSFVAPIRALLAVFLACTCVSSCGAPREQAPAIAFTTVPEAASGGSGRLAPIGGRVTGARPGQQIVLFARSGVWWVQPLTTSPYTAIAADSTWKNTTHLGSEYAALLVEPGYRPPDRAESLPAAGGQVVAVATVSGTGSAAARPQKTLSFSGYEWEVRDVPSDRGGANDYDSANARVDADGSLHLTLAERDGRWSSAEVILTRTLGYGTYAFTVRDVSGLDPAAAFGMLTWDEGASDRNHRELDIEISQWGDRSIQNAQYVLQPFYVPANVARFSAPAGTLTHALRWEPGRALFKTFKGAQPTGTPVAQHEFTAGVPATGGERVRMNLYYFRYAPQPPQRNVEVVIERFHYLP